ncbi:MAG: hypothetical protein ACT4N2_13585 [Hyphomicrobium sp.]
MCSGCGDGRHNGRPLAPLGRSLDRTSTRYNSLEISGLLLTIALLVLLTIAAAARMLIPLQGEMGVRFRTDPDGPAAFGCSMAWIAIRSRDTAAVMDALGLTSVSICNWNAGIGTVYDAKLGENHVYVSPPVGPWTFVVGLPLPHPVGRSFADKCTPLLVSLGGRFPDVQFYFSYPPLDFFAWARMLDGRLMRAFAIGDEGILWSKGRLSREEKALGLKLYELRGVKGRRGDAGGEMILHPTEDHVLGLAARWSLDPTRLDTGSAPPALGHIALAPLVWRAERLKKTA